MVVKLKDESFESSTTVSFGLLKSQRSFNTTPLPSKSNIELISGINKEGKAVLNGKSTGGRVSANTVKIIPSVGNDFRGRGPKAFNSKRYLPPKEDAAFAKNEDRFEQELKVEEEEVKYGLHVMARKILQKTDKLSSQLHVESNEPDESNTFTPHKCAEKEVLQEDLKSLPDEATLEEYEAMPVELYGKAMLMGMGWCEKDLNKETAAKEYVRRLPLLGLGATPCVIASSSNNAKETKDMVVYDKEGNIKHTRTANEKLVERKPKGPFEGKKMFLVKGKHAGLDCTILKIHKMHDDGYQVATVKIHVSNEKVIVDLTDLDELELRKRGEKRKVLESSINKSQIVNSSQGQPEVKKSQLNKKAWLFPDIRVKFTDKNFKDGRFYLKKGLILDVPTHQSCCVAFDDGTKVDEVLQWQLETVVPKKLGTRVLVLVNELRGKIGTILSRNVNSAMAAVQLNHDMSVQRFSFDDIAEFVGNEIDE